MQTRDMLTNHPRFKREDGDLDALVRCIEACYGCAQACISCADACLAERDVAEQVRCIRLNLDCADVCSAVGAVLTRRTGDNRAVVEALLRACTEACGACAMECERHADAMAHCRVCASECRACEDACMALGGAA